jgi:GntR family transcriptional regulator
MIDHFGARPVYEQLADILRAAIADGTYPPGTWLPRTHELESEHKLAAGTIRKSLAVLRAEGLIQTVPGRGNIVIRPPPAE